MTARLQWASDELYEGRLTAHASVAGHTLAEIATSGGCSCCKGKKGQATGSSAAAAELPVLLLIDTAGCGCEEEKEEEGDSKANSGEAKVGGGVGAYLLHMPQ